MRNSNSYGSITLIDKKSKRRKPYRVQIHVDWTDDGKPIRKTIGYAKTRVEGRQLLAEYHDKPFDLDMNNVSFKFLYDKWYKYKQKTGIVGSSLKKYIYIRKYYDCIETKIFNEITREDIQRIIDNSAVKGSYQGRIRNLYHQMYEYAKANNIKVGHDVSTLVIVKKEEESKLHQPFTDEEINKLWNNRNEFVDIILINIYTGCRPIELLKISEVHENYFITGSKTEAGKNRVIPLNNKIKNIFKETYNSKILTKFKSEDNYYQKFKKAMEKMNMKHSPYDCRHTFATLMSNAKANDHCTKLIMGHKIEDLTKRIYTHKVIEDLIEEVNKI